MAEGLRTTVVLVMRRRAALFGAFVIAGMASCAVLAPYVAPHDPYQPKLQVRFVPPLWADEGTLVYPLGTDALGRDLLSRLMYGARVSLSVGLLAVVLPGILGVTLGMLAGYFGSLIDALVDSSVNVMMAFPFMLLALSSVAVMSPSFENIVIVLTVTGWPLYARLVRAEVLRYREQELVAAARAIGCRSSRIIIRHLLPNLMSTILVIGTLEVPRMIILESFLSFLGLGIQPPTPSWGGMLSDGRAYLLDRWWLTAFPGLMIFVTTLGMNLFGDGLRDMLDPRLVVLERN